ncbi:MAG: molybdopterin molybdotransferase MoeA [Verrucomicrobia bacterium]|nr:molybdopterin molybdotransferase MoeA [Verrucomicrobiota bacterium]
MLELEEAQRRILSVIKPLETVETTVIEAAGRVLAEPIESSVNLPPFDNSAMDGYAVIADDLKSASATTPVPLRLIGKVAAGAVFRGEVSRGTCVRLFTGSPIPAGADSVIMQEDTHWEESDPEVVQFLDRVKPWENIRIQGEDVRRGVLIAKVGARLSFGKISLLAGTGREVIRVFRQPIVGLIATGSELCEAGQSLKPGQIYESNRAGLSVVVSMIGAVPKIYPIVEDTPPATEFMLRQSLQECDVVITSGGVSVGEFDYVKSAFQKLGGNLDFWRVAVRPGKPFVFGQLKEKCLFGLPGNPVSAFVTYLLLARPALLRMQGASDLQLRKQPGVLRENMNNRGDRRHFARVVIDELGEVRSAGLQGSHALSSLSVANGLVDVPPRTELHSGETVAAMRWD